MQVLRKCPAGHVKYSLMELPQIFDVIIEDRQILGWPQKMILYEEFREAAALIADQKSPLAIAYQSSTLFQLGLCEMTGYGCDNNPRE